MFFQMLLLTTIWQILPYASMPLLTPKDGSCGSPIVSGHISAPTLISPPILDEPRFFIWQHVMLAADNPETTKRTGYDAALGHGAAREMSYHSPGMFFQMLLLTTMWQILPYASTPLLVPKDCACGSTIISGHISAPTLVSEPIPDKPRFFIWQHVTLAADNPETTKRTGYDAALGYGTAGYISYHSPGMFFQMLLPTTIWQILPYASTPLLVPKDGACGSPIVSGRISAPRLVSPLILDKPRFFIWQHVTLAADNSGTSQRTGYDAALGHGTAREMSYHSPGMFF